MRFRIFLLSYTLLRSILTYIAAKTCRDAGRDVVDRPSSFAALAPRQCAIHELPFCCAQFAKRSLVSKRKQLKFCSLQYAGHFSRCTTTEIRLALPSPYIRSGRFLYGGT